MLTARGGACEELVRTGNDMLITAASGTCNDDDDDDDDDDSLSSRISRLLVTLAADS
jgi:hypothetical protein